MLDLFPSVQRSAGQDNLKPACQGLPAKGCTSARRQKVLDLAGHRDDDRAREPVRHWGRRGTPCPQGSQVGLLGLLPAG
ncbi:hypothetical protein [Streptomyces sp. SID8111]|uniref:hypothetical protein n=1 Tax=Streptomyces sp. SID8111 TaxID=2706100 RepID=UPI00194294CF|nr:hypothetical protein [Streptomyces sp. SID8111]